MLNSLLNRFFSDQGIGRRTLWFKNLLYIFLIYKCITEGLQFDLLFANNPVLYPSYRSIGPLRDLAFILLKYPADWLCWTFLAGMGLLAFYRLIFRPSYDQAWAVGVSVCIDLILWFLVLNLNNRMYFALSGGNLLLNQLLLFNVFLWKFRPEGKGAEYLFFMENVAILALRLELMLLYLVSALSKLQHEEWLNGGALLQVLRTEHFSGFAMDTANSAIILLFWVLNYLVLGFQLLFPIMVWWKRVTPWFLLLGIGMHLFIGMYMGLPGFAFIMLLGYLYLWPKN